MNSTFTFQTEGREFSAEPERVNFNGTEGNFWTFREMVDGGNVHCARFFAPLRTTKAKLIDELEWNL